MCGNVLIRCRPDGTTRDLRACAGWKQEPFVARCIARRMAGARMLRCAAIVSPGSHDAKAPFAIEFEGRGRVGAEMGVAVNGNRNGAECTQDHKDVPDMAIHAIPLVSRCQRARSMLRDSDTVPIATHIAAKATHA